MSSLTMLVIADPHYVHHAARECSVPRRLGRFALEWTRRALDDAMRTDALDAIVVLGDVVDDGNAPGADGDLAEFASLSRASGLPVIAVPGNHDGDPARFLEAFGDQLGAHAVCGYCVYTFAESYAPNDVATRPPEAIEEFLAAAGQGPIITIQHNPLYPPVDCSQYPFMLTNNDAVLSAYERRQVVLALSGHYHAGQALARRNGVAYFTAATLSEEPFRCYIARLNGREPTIEECQLQMPLGTALVDGHIHTPFGYCRIDVAPVPAQERARALGLAGIVCVEHAGQLYLTAEQYWHRAHIDHPQSISDATARGLNRMPAFRAALQGFRSDFVRVGLEAECDCNGDLTLPEEDRHGWDVLMGAIHWLPEDLPAHTASECARSFMHVAEKLVPQGIDVLGHPFRFFHQKGLARPTGLYRPLAELLAAHGVKAEVNFHHNEPDPEFFRICIELGVRLTPGSDAHELREVGHFRPHIRFLAQIGHRLPDSPAPRDQP